MPIHIQLETFLPKQPEFDHYKYRPRVIVIFFIVIIFIIIVGIHHLGKKVKINTDKKLTQRNITPVRAVSNLFSVS